MLERIELRQLAAVVRPSAFGDPFTPTHGFGFPAVNDRLERNDSITNRTAGIVPAPDE